MYYMAIRTLCLTLNLHQVTNVLINDSISNNMVFTIFIVSFDLRLFVHSYKHNEPSNLLFLLRALQEMGEQVVFKSSKLGKWDLVCQIFKPKCP